MNRHEVIDARLESETMHQPNSTWPANTPPYS